MAVSASLVLDTGGKAKNYMGNIQYNSAPTSIEDALDEALVVSDMLPSPDELVRKSEKVKVTIALDKDSVELFRAYAKKRNAKYQTMINGVISSYADTYLKKAHKGAPREHLQK